MAFDIEAWSDYGVAIVGGAAALSGLLFVAVSVHAAWFSSSEAHRGRAGQAFVLFIVPLLTGILLLIPGQGTTALGIEIGVFGLLVGRVLMLLDTDELKGEPRALVVDRFSPRVLVTVAQVAGGASLIERRFGRLHWLAAAHVGAVLGGLVNAWISDLRPLAACQGDQLGAVWALVRLRRSLPPATAGSRAAMKIVVPRSTNLRLADTS